MKKLGVMGGLGPMATVYFLQRVTEMTRAVKDQEHIEIICYSCPSIPDRTTYILDNTKDNPLNEMKDKCMLLEKLGADIIAIPCITAHYFYRELVESVNIPIINVIQKTAEYLKEQGDDKIGIMATDGTVCSGIFEEEFQRYGIEFFYPEKKYQQSIMEAIYNIKSGKQINIEALKSVGRNLRDKGAEVNLLGCTELSLLKRDNVLKYGYLDVIDILAKSSVENFGKLNREYSELIMLGDDE